jgi:hypothetical protein
MNSDFWNVTQYDPMNVMRRFGGTSQKDFCIRITGFLGFVHRPVF